MQKQKDRDTVVEQKEKNKRLEEEIERLNIEQQRLKESNNAIKVQMKEVTRAIVSIHYAYSYEYRIVQKTKSRMRIKLHQNQEIRLLPHHVN